MSGHNPQRRAARGRRLLLAAVFLALVLFVVLIAVVPARSARSAAQPQPTPAATANSSLTQRVSSAAAVRTPGLSSAPGAPTQKILNYGRGEGELGMLQQPELEPRVPESFAIGKEGEILVADGVNQRVVIYNRDGTYLRSVNLPGVALGDVTTDPAGRLLVYDQARCALLACEPDGTLRSTLQLNRKDIDTRGYFHTTGNSVYFADAAARDVLVATVQEGVLAAAHEPAARSTDGIHGESGRIYSVSLDRGRALRLRLREAAPAREQSLEVPVAGLVSARFAGEDRAQRFYVQTERLEGNTVVLEVLAFSPSGERLGVTRMPENDYVAWTAKLVDVRPDGTLVQFLPQRQQARLNLYANW